MMLARPRSPRSLELALVAHVTTEGLRAPEGEAGPAYSDAPAYLVDALVEHGVRGIVIDGVGAGSLGSLAAAVEAAQKKGVVAVATARTHGGRVQGAPRRHESGVRLALTRTTDAEEIQRIFNEY